MTKVQLSLTPQEADILKDYGSQFGYSLAKTIRYIITKTSEEFLQQDNTPVFPMTEEQEKKGFQALQDFKKGKTKQVKNVDNFFNNL